jgi:hypothetical protein
VLAEDSEATIEQLADSAVAAFLRSQGYNLFAKTGFTLIFRLA